MRCRVLGQRWILGAETLSARAASRGVWIIHFEAAVLQGVDEIKFRSGDIEGAFGIDHDSDPRGLHHNVSVGRGILEVHFVLESRAASADHGDP